MSDGPFQGAQGRRQVDPVDRAFFDWGLVLDRPLDPLRTARIEVDATGVRHYNADGMLTMEVTNPEPEPAEHSMRAALDRDDAFPVRRENAQSGRIWPYVLVGVALMTAGLVWLLVWNSHHAHQQTDAAIATCEHGGTYLYGDRQLVRLSWSVRLDGPSVQHIDYLVTEVPHTGGGMCLIPEDTAARR